MQFNIDFRKITNLIDLMKLMRKLLIVSWGADKVTFTAAYPKSTSPTDLTTPIITYKTKSKLPGKFNNTSEIRPRYRSDIEIANTNLPIEAKFIEIYGQMFDYYVEFEIWAEDGEEADEIANKFQEFMFKYIGYFKELGVDRIYFEEMNSDASSGKWRTDLINRSLIYHIRIDEIVAIKVPTIEKVTVDLIKYEDKFQRIVELIEKKDGKETTEEI